MTETTAEALDYHERFIVERDKGRFVVPWCADCGLRFWHPRRHCPECASPRIDYVEPKWPARVYTYTVMHRASKENKPAETSTVGYIELDDGLRILVALDIPTESDVIGSPVRPALITAEDGGVSFVFVASSN